MPNLNNTKKQCQINFQKHIESIRYYSFYYNCLIIPTIIISSIVTILSAYITGFNEINREYNLILLILSAINTCLINIINFLKLDSKIENHRVCSDLYDNLITKINFEITNSDEDQVKFYNMLETEILNIKKTNIYIFPKKFKIDDGLYDESQPLISNI